VGTFRATGTGLPFVTVRKCGQGKRYRHAAAKTVLL
jgi:hypothetical protein